MLHIAETAFVAEKNDLSSPEKTFMEAYEAAMENYNPFSDDPYVLGDLENYDSREFLWDDEDDRRCKIFIHNGKILVTSFNNGVHEKAAAIIGRAVEDALNASTGMVGKVFYASGATDIEIINLLGCKSRFIKQPDYSITLDEKLLKNRKHPSIVFEIGVSHENLDLLLNEASALLNRFTHIQYCILAKIYAEINVFVMDIFVCQRTEAQCFYTSKEVWNTKIGDYLQMIGADKLQKKSICKDPFDPYPKSKAELNAYYKLLVLFRKRVTHANIHEDIRFRLETSGLVEGSDFSFEQHEVEVVISSEELQEIEDEFYAYRRERGRTLDDLSTSDQEPDPAE